MPSCTSKRVLANTCHLKLMVACGRSGQGRAGWGWKGGGGGGAHAGPGWRGSAAAPGQADLHRRQAEDRERRAAGLPALEQRLQEAILVGVGRRAHVDLAGHRTRSEGLAGAGFTAHSKNAGQRTRTHASVRAPRRPQGPPCSPSLQCMASRETGGSYSQRAACTCFAPGGQAGAPSTHHPGLLSSALR
jgi:hypothetical protein